jgi:protein phosphatase
LKRAFGYHTEQRKRSENQDSFGVFPFDGYTLAIVCDGMGGHVGGAQASTLAVRTVHECMTDVGSDYGAALRTALEKANQAIYEAARKNHRLMGMGTTAVAAVVTDDGTAHVAHVGDSRAYLINEGQAVQVTRDHTMVNLFVDAELLSPEDAATHPEAHVLSRSLGVERQVEVEVSDPIELADNDVVFLCSDGVHGVVTDWELGSVDWTAPEPGIKHVLQIVDAREGDDNATAVAVLIGEGDSMPASPLPEAKSIEDSMGLGAGILGGNTIVPDEEDEYEPLSDPASYGTEPSAPGRAAAPPVEDLTSEPDEPAPEPVAAKPKDPTPQPLQRKQTPDRSRSLVKPLIAGAVGLLVAGGGLAAVFVLTQPSGDVDEPPPDDLVVANVDPAPVPEPITEPDEPAPVAPEPEEPEPLLVLSPPESPRRLPHRAKRYNQSPPKSAQMFRVVQAARDRKCAESLTAMQEAMDVSSDNAKLYSQVWYCFNDAHSKPLDGRSLADPASFAELEQHFRGWPAPGEDTIQWTPEDKKVPLWFRQAPGGLEHRLEFWAESNEDDLMREVMTDLKGEATVTDDLARDIWMEAAAAVALSKVEDPDDATTEAWARRVYVTARALGGRTGRLLKTHRPELVPKLEEMLAEATTVPEDAKLPGDVEKALAVGRGEEESPTVRPVGRPRPAQDVLKEPDLGEGTDDVPDQIHR